MLFYIHIQYSQAGSSNQQLKQPCLNHKGDPITRFGIYYLLKKYVEKAKKINPALKNKVISPHTIRHATAFHLLQSGVEINIIQHWLGHACLNTTNRYIKINFEMMDERSNGEK